MDEGLDVLVNKMERLTKLVAIGLVVGRAQGEQVSLLAKAGFQPKEIAGLIGSTANSVRVALSSMRRAKNKKLTCPTDGGRRNR